MGGEVVARREGGRCLGMDGGKMCGGKESLDDMKGGWGVSSERGYGGRICVHLVIRGGRVERKKEVVA